MKKLLKSITRETLRMTDRKNLPVIVTLKAGDFLEFRSKGKRFRIEVPLAACYNMALVYTAKELYAIKLKRYLEGRKDGRRMRKPRQFPKIFNPKVYECLIKANH